MAKMRNLSEIQQEIVFTEFDFYQQYVLIFQHIYRYSAGTVPPGVFLCKR